MLVGGAILAFLTKLLLVARSRLRSRASLEAENLALRQQVIVLSRKSPSRVRLRTGAVTPTYFRQLLDGRRTEGHVDEKPLHEGEFVAGVNPPKVNFNFPSRALGEEIHTKLLDLFAQGSIKPVIGLEAKFDELPSAIDRFERRETYGRVIVHI